MSRTHAPDRTGRPARTSDGQKARRPQRKPRAPEPKDVISGAGHPLDPSVRRELEARLGHDFSRVRVHTDRDSAELAGLVGADAVTVGQDVFFAADRFRPGTQDGLRLLAHELLHTVQAPDPLGALRAGRDFGGVSLPQDAIEREAETGARDTGERQPEVSQGSATPGWLRYARVDADQYRSERLDPATLADRLTAGILRSLRGDPADASGRVRLQLGRFAPELQSAVLDRLRVRLPSSDYDHVLDLAEQGARADSVPDTVQTPEPVMDADDLRESDRDYEAQDADERHWQERQRAVDAAREPAPDSSRASVPERGPAGEHEQRRRGGHGEHGRDEKNGKDGKDGKDEKKDGDGKDGKGERTRKKRSPAAGKAGKAEPGQGPDAGQGTDAAPAADAGAQAVDSSAPAGAPGAAPTVLDTQGGGPAAAADGPNAQDAGTTDGAQPAGEAGNAAAAQAPGAPDRAQQDARRQPAAGSKTQESSHRQQPQPGEAKPEQVDKVAEAKDSPLAKHGLLDDEEQGGEPREEERPDGLEPGADEDGAVSEASDAAEPAESLPGPELAPEDFLPSTDLDVSGVPTADRMTPGEQPATPSFPEPPPTKAEQVQAQRANEPDDDEAPAAPGGPSRTSGAEAGNREAEDRTASDLHSGRPVDSEIGPDPETAQPAAGPAAGPAAASQEPAKPEPEEPEQAADPQESAAERNRRQEPEHGPGAARAPAGPGTQGATGPVRRAPAVTSAAPAVATTQLGAGPGALPAAHSAAHGPAAQQADAPGPLGVPGAQPAANASLEPGGGACAGAQQPSTEADKPEGGAGGCGGGGGGATKQAQKPAPPDVSGQDPQTALATAGSLPLDQSATALDGADKSVARTVGQQRTALRNASPTAQRPSGAPSTQSGAPKEAAPAAAVTKRLERVTPKGAAHDLDKGDAKQVEGQNPAQQVQSPNVGETSGKANARDVQNMQGAVNEVPSTDPGLNVTVGPAPQVDLTGDADPQQMDDQSDRLHDRSTEILKVGQDDAAKPMGEDRIYPDVPKETLRGTVPGGAPSSGGAQPKIAGADQPGVAEVAQQERGAQVHAAVGQGQGQMTTAQTKQKQGEAEARKKNQADIDKSTADNARRQTGERGSAGEAVRRERVQWRGEQDKKISDADADAGKQHTEKGRQVLAKRDDANKQVESRQDKDNKSIQDHRKQAEDKARKEKARKKEESSGWWGWVKSKAQQAFNALVSAVTAIFDFFRKAINGIIGAFKKFADWAIDQARKLAVGLIKALADALIGICDVLLAAFPGLRDKFRKAIEKWRDKAIARVNQLAEELKAAVNKFLDLLADGLNALLNLYEKALKAAIKYVHDKVVAAIEFAQKAIALYGQFKALIGDIAEDPGGWLKKLGNQAMDGIQHHLWGAIKAAVKTWFDEKVESVVGLTSTLVNILVKGCISLKQIGRMAWQAVVAALPMMIIQIVIEKVVSMIVPAAGAILTVIQGLMAAWGTISKIITAFGKFFAFLKAVKSGAGACLFAVAVAAGVVALLEFITNFLLSKLKSAGKAVGTKLKAIAQRIMKALAKAGKGVRKAVGTAVNRAKAGLKNATAALRGPEHHEPAPAGHPHGEPARSPHHVAEPSRPKPAHEPEPKHQPTHEQEPKKPREQEPKPKRSRVGSALTRAKTAAKGALKKVGNAAKALGRKLKNSKLGKALLNGAKKVKNAFTRQKDRLKNWWTKHKKAKEDRRKKENSPAAKEERLQKILARIRPPISWMLKSGVRRLSFGLALSSMRVWYRLTSLILDGNSPFRVIATLNPSGSAGEGEGAKAEVAERLKEFLNKDPERRTRLEAALEISSIDDWLLFRGNEDADRFMMKIRRILKDLNAAERNNSKDQVLGTIGQAEREVKNTLSKMEKDGTGWAAQFGRSSIQESEDKVGQEENAFNRIHMGSRIQKAKSQIAGNGSLPRGRARVAWDPEKMGDKIAFTRKAIALKRAGERGEISKYRSSAGEHFIDQYDRSELIDRFGETAERTTPPKRPVESPKNPEDATRIKDISMRFMQAVRIRADILAAPKGAKFRRDVRERLDTMNADHTVELQSAGIDSYENLHLIDREMNQATKNQIFNSVRNSDYGAIYSFDISIL